MSLLPAGWEVPQFGVGRVAPPARVQLNASGSPWGYTTQHPPARGAQAPLEHPATVHPNDHRVIAHPNPSRLPFPQVSPFSDGTGALLGRVLRAVEHVPGFVAPGLRRGTRR